MRQKSVIITGSPPSSSSWSRVKRPSGGREYAIRGTIVGRRQLFPKKREEPFAPVGFSLGYVVQSATDCRADDQIGQGGFV
jgi:hypothetical protein